MTEYECALSGELADKSDLVADEDDDMPVGWTRVTLERRLINPEWLDVQNVKSTLIEAALMQVPEESRGAMFPLVMRQIEAQFAALEDRLGQYETVTEVVYIAPVESDEQLASEYNEIRERLGLAAVDADETEAAEDEADEADAEDAGEE
jgi:hypothetical protein